MQIINKLEEMEKTGISPESSKIELKKKGLTNGSSFVKGYEFCLWKTQEEEAKLEVTFFTKCQKYFEEKEMFFFFFMCSY